MMKISNMKPGDEAIVNGYAVSRSAYRAKLLALGLTRGAVIKLVGVAPMGDPVRVLVRGFELSLRKEEADALLLESTSQSSGCNL